MGIFRLKLVDNDIGVFYLLYVVPVYRSASVYDLDTSLVNALAIKINNKKKAYIWKIYAFYK